MEVEMRIRGLMMDPMTNMPIVVLKDVGSDAVLPIWVGVYEANAIALEIDKVSTPRPMTHDLIKTLLHGLGTGIRKVVVSELKDDTFYAVIWLDKDGDLIMASHSDDEAEPQILRTEDPEKLWEELQKTAKDKRPPSIFAQAAAALKAATRGSHDSARIAKIREILERTTKEIEALEKS